MNGLTPTLTPGSTQRDRGGRSDGGWAWLLATIALVLAGNLLYSRTLFPDSFYSLYTGRYITRHGLPHANDFTSVSHAALWVDQQWLAQVLYYCAWVAGGYRALAALSAALVTSGFAVLALVMRHRGISPGGMAAWTLAAFGACLGNTSIQAQSFGYLAFGLTLWLVLTDNESPRLRPRTWLVIAVLVLWANTHGSVLLGAGLVTVYAGYRAVTALRCGERRPALAYLGLGGVAALCPGFTPYGTGILWYYGRFIGNSALSHNVPEWARPDLLNPLSWGFFALAAAAAITVIVRWRAGTRPDPVLLGLGAALLALALTGMRFQVWFAMGASLLAADVLGRRSKARPASPVLLRTGAVAFMTLALLCLGLLATTPASHFVALVPRRALAAAAEAAARGPATRVLGDEWSGTPMLWLYPKTLGHVGIDVRLEEYSSQEIEAYADFLTLRGRRWQRILGRYDIVVVSRRRHPQLADALTGLNGWRVVFQDRAGLVLERRPGPGRVRQS